MRGAQLEQPVGGAELHKPQERNNVGFFGGDANVAADSDLGVVQVSYARR